MVPAASLAVRYTGVQSFRSFQMKPYLSLPIAGSIIALCLVFSGVSQAAVSSAHLTAPAGAHTSNVTKTHWRHHHPRHYRHYRHCRWHHHHRVCH